MAKRRERPRCREVIEKLLREKNCTLEDLLSRKRELSDALRIQARKMLEEQEQPEPRKRAD